MVRYKERLRGTRRTRIHASTPNHIRAANQKEQVMDAYLCLLLRPPDLDEGDRPDQERRRDGRPHVGLERPDDGPEGRERPRQGRDERHLVGVEGVGLGDHVAAVVVHVDGAHDDVNLSPKTELIRS